MFGVIVLTPHSSLLSMVVSRAIIGNSASELCYTSLGAHTGTREQIELPDHCARNYEKTNTCQIPNITSPPLLMMLSILYSFIQDVQNQCLLFQALLTPLQIERYVLKLKIISRDLDHCAQKHCLTVLWDTKITHAIMLTHCRIFT